MVAPRILMTAVRVAASTLFLMPATSFLDSSLDSAFASPAKPGVTQQTKSKFSYVPPNRGTPRRTQATGSRGCTEAAPVKLALLVPNDHTAQTSLGHPTFFWNISEKPEQPLEFALVESGIAKPIFVQQVQVENAGIAKLEMPSNLPELVPGKEYRWSVTLICNKNRRSNDTFVQSWIKRVARSPQVEEKLTAATSDRDRASVYAEAGLWFDALNAISSNSSKDEFMLLLDQVGLSEVAVQDRQTVARQ